MYKVLHYNRSLFPQKRLELANDIINIMVPIDRTGIINSLDMAYIPVATVPDNWYKSFEQVALERATQLWKQNKNITVLYSGGIDSVTAWVSLLETKPSDGNLVACYTKHSIDEFPLLHEKTITDSPTPSSILFGPGIAPLYENHDILKISGCAGDTLFGSKKMFDGEHFDKRNDPWENIIFWEEFAHIKEGLAATLFDQVADYVYTIGDLYWWLNFTLQWDIKAMMFVYAKTPEVRSCESFFTCPEFERWSIHTQLNNPQIKVGDSPEKWKQPAKDYIHKYFPDEDYRRYKLKVPSHRAALHEAFPEDYKTPGLVKSHRHTNNELSIVLSDGRYWRMNEEIPQDVLDQITLP
jgi:hypothetical protein